MTARKIKTGTVEVKVGAPTTTRHVTCPYCHTTLQGGIREDILVMKCWQCKRPFKLSNPDSWWDGVKD